MPKFYMKHTGKSGAMFSQTVECDDFAHARSIADDLCRKRGWLLTSLYEMTPAQASSYDPRMPSPETHAVTKHLTPAGVEYRDEAGVVVAVLDRRGSNWEVTPAFPELDGMPDVHAGYFNSAKAADAYAWVLNLERMGA